MAAVVTSAGLKFDGSLSISVGDSVKSRMWIRKDLRWSDFLEKLSIPVVTKDTKEVYRNADANAKTKYKDVGGYIGGVLADTDRKKSSVISRRLITLDLDSCENLDATWFLFCLQYNCAGAIHTTHSHRPEAPRARLIVPLKYDMSPKNYKLISEELANSLGVGQFDATTHEPNRLMFWPSVCVNAQNEYFFEYNDEEWLDPNNLLKERKEKDLINEVTQNDPTQIKGIVGAFNRKHDVPSAIETFLPGVYESCGEHRYRLIGADSAPGVIIYKGGQYGYSHHAGDRAQGRPFHAFDVVCEHKFNGNKEEMQAWLISEGIILQQDNEFADSLTLGKDGTPEPTIENVRRILNSDPAVCQSVALDEFANKLLIYGDFPWMGLMDRDSFTWTDTDDAGLRMFFESKYGITDRNKILDGLLLAAADKKVHPVRQHLLSLTWDGEPRVDNLLVNFLKAEATPYVKAVTRKALIGAVARIFQPGCKHDHVLVLVGPQGCRKSTTIGKLGGQWYTDSLYTVQGKEAYELLQGYWLIEMSEMAATRRSEAEMIKQFISKRSDNFRAAYDRRTVDHPRQCAFFGSTNDEEFLKDVTGNRRFWPVAVDKVPESMYEKFDDEYIRQVWAECVAAYKAGEKWYLDEMQEKTAKEVQEVHTQKSAHHGGIMAFIESPVPAGWRQLKLDERMQAYATGFKDDNGLIKRDRVCALEIWLEHIGGTKRDYTISKAADINATMKAIGGWKKKLGTFGPEYGMQTGWFRE
jgi:predicted P-loop ATPase